jgi:hypothetical protein
MKTGSSGRATRRGVATTGMVGVFFFFFINLDLELSDTKVYEP